jgi:HEAT repeat protein
LLDRPPATASIIMTGASGQRLLFLLCGLAAVTMAGCAELDFLPSWVPFQGPASDEMPGVVTPSQRIVELRKLSEKAASSSEEEKQRVSQQLVTTIQTEKDPLIRLEIIRTLGKYPGTGADTILRAALNDADSQVRVTACEAWGKRGSAEAIKLLSDILRSDVDADVRLAAAKALGATKSKDAVPALGEALSDSDPAMQYRAMLSLEQTTGKNFGNDVNRWQAYVKGERPEGSPSLAEQLRRLF